MIHKHMSDRPEPLQRRLHKDAHESEEDAQADTAHQAEDADRAATGRPLHSLCIARCCASPVHAHRACQWPSKIEERLSRLLLMADRIDGNGQGNNLPLAATSNQGCERQAALMFERCT